MLSAEDLPRGAISRLTDHCGPRVAGWLHAAPLQIEVAAQRWGLRVESFHDAGWTSLIAVCRARGGERFIVKALPERDRFVQERAALEHWSGEGAAALVDHSDEEQLLLMKAVAAKPGGAARPHDHPVRAARALHRLHGKAAGELPIPDLATYYRDTVIPRIRARAARFDAVGKPEIDRILATAMRLTCDVSGRALLHADLYAENVLFDEAGRTVFLDPHPKIGHASFDWAFWCVYYIPTSDFLERLELCRRYAPCDINTILRWAATLALDGLLFYLDTQDARTAAMLRILETPEVRDSLG